jgi:hypothetical protein
MSHSPQAFFIDIGKKTPNNQNNPEQKEQCWRLSQYLISNYTTVTVIKTAWYLAKSTQVQP